MWNKVTFFKIFAAAMASAVALTPAVAVAEIGPEDNMTDTFVLPAPEDQDGPAVTARPVASVEERTLDPVSVAPDDFDAMITLGPVPVAPVRVRTAAVVADTAPTGSDPETVMWRRADASGDAERVKVYMLTYPHGRYVEQAKARFVALLRAMPRAASTTPTVIYERVPVPVPAALPAREYRRPPYHDAPPFNRGRPFQDPHRRGFL